MSVEPADRGGGDEVPARLTAPVRDLDSTPGPYDSSPDGGGGGGGPNHVSGDRLDNGTGGGGYGGLQWNGLARDSRSKLDTTTTATITSGQSNLT